mgnify:FL=1
MGVCLLRRKLVFDFRERCGNVCRGAGLAAGAAEAVKSAGPLKSRRAWMRSGVELQKASGLGKQPVLEPWQDRGHEPLINSHRIGRVGAVVAIGFLGWSSRPPSRFRPLAFWDHPATPPKLHSVGAGCGQCLRGGNGIEEKGIYF